MGSPQFHTCEPLPFPFLPLFIPLHHLPNPTPPQKGRTVQLVVKINEFRYRLALFRSSCVTRAIPTSILDADISSTPRHNAALCDLRNRSGSWALYILLPSYVNSFYDPPGERIMAGRSPGRQYQRIWPHCGLRFYQLDTLVPLSWPSWGFLLTPQPPPQALTTSGGC